jgi:hypothetical protein
VFYANVGGYFERDYIEDMHHALRVRDAQTTSAPPAPVVAKQKKVSPSRVEIDDTPYIRAHGKAPRGVGYWAFGPKPTTDCMQCKFFHGTVVVAKKAAREWAVTQNFDTLYMQS